MDCRQELQKRHKVVDLEKGKVYVGTQEQVHYEQFEDTIKYMPYEKWKQFIQEAKLIPDRDRIRNILIFRLLVSTGARIFEFSQIKVNQLNFSNNTIDIPYEVTKTKKRRTVRVNPELMLDLRDYINSNNIKSGFLFRNSKRNPISIRTYERLFDKYFIKYGLMEKLNLDSKPTPHQCRHNHIIFSLQNKIPIPVVSKNVGHKRITTTQIYSNFAIKDIVDAYKEVEF